MTSQAVFLFWGLSSCGRTAHSSDGSPDIPISMLSASTSSPRDGKVGPSPLVKALRGCKGPGRAVGSKPVNGSAIGTMTSKGRVKRSWAVVLVALRALLVVFALQSSGAIHDIFDFVETVTAVPDKAEHEQCPVDGPCNDCPPGCPNCHCAALGLVAPASPMAILPQQLLASALPASLAETQAPRRPDLPGLFRPPQV